MDSFKQQYSSPKWQKKRLEVLESRGYQCESCGDSESLLHVHHKKYIKNHKIWEYEEKKFLVLCEDCHTSLHDELDDIKTFLGEIPPENYLDILHLLYLIHQFNPSEIKKVIDLACEKAGELNEH